jgi:hypothetical protein
VLKKCMASAQASAVKKQGHKDEADFDNAMKAFLKARGRENGPTSVHKSSPLGKKDVGDPSGNMHTLKGGDAKWQFALYGRNHFNDEKDAIFAQLNGTGKLIQDMLDAYPETLADYKKDKQTTKDKLAMLMSQLAQKLQSKGYLSAWLQNTLVGGGDAVYFTIVYGPTYHMFHKDDIIKTLVDNCTITTSGAKKGEKAQKVIFQAEVGKYDKATEKPKLVSVAEIEIRHDDLHYREFLFHGDRNHLIKLFNMYIPKASPQLIARGKAIKTLEWFRENSNDQAK